MTNPKPQLLDDAGNALPAADPDKRYIKFDLTFEVEESRMLDLSFTEFRDETKENLALMTHMILEQVLDTRKKALARQGAAPAREPGEPQPS